MQLTPDMRTAVVEARLVGCERSLLGGLMHAGTDRDAVLSQTQADDFSTDAHQTVYRVIRDLWAEHEPVELLTVSDRLCKSGGMSKLAPNDAVGSVWLAELYASGASATEYYLAEVLDGSRRRSLGRIARSILMECEAPNGPASELIDKAVARVSALAERGQSTSRLKTSAEVTNEAIEAYDRRARGERSVGIPTGLTDLDNMTGGLNPAQMTILAARPSVGKTALAQQIARNAAKNNYPVLFASLEQPSNELGERGLAATAQVDGQILRMGKRMRDSELERMVPAADHLRTLNLNYDDTPGQSVLHILSTARRLKRTTGLALVIVDYLQLIPPDDSRSSRNDQLDTITRRIREMARELNVAALALSQLSRDCEKQNRRPRLSDLRDSGALEQHADNVMILHRPERTGSDIDPVELSIEKQRNGPTGLVNLQYRRRVLTFENSAMEFPE